MAEWADCAGGLVGRPDQRVAAAPAVLCAGRPEKGDDHDTTHAPLQIEVHRLACAFGDPDPADEFCSIRSGRQSVKPVALKHSHFRLGTARRPNAYTSTAARVHHRHRTEWR